MKFFLGDIHIVLVISKLVLCLLILNNTNPTSILKFVPLIHLQQEITKAFDKAARKYYDETPKEEKTSLEVTTMMRAKTKTKQQSFKASFQSLLQWQIPNSIINF